jgi:1-phosphatidylinositol-3-phosphate 5-kinase
VRGLPSFGHRLKTFLLRLWQVLNIKPALMERISRCTGGEVVPPEDPPAAPKIGHCEAFHVERFVEEHGSAGQEGRKNTKTLMFFEGCPKPLGCTVSHWLCAS